MKSTMSLLLLSMTAGFMLMIAGLLGCASTRCSTGYDLGAVFAVIRWIAAKPEQLSRDMQQPTVPNPTPYQEIAGETAQQWSEFGAQQIEKATNGNSDPRLVQCPADTVSSGAELTYTKAQEALSKKFASVDNLIVFLNTPHCRLESGRVTRLRWLVAGGRILDADVDGTTIKLTPTNF
jgi:hypothetical protein